MPVSKATATPANQQAGSCRRRIQAEEKRSSLVPKRDSRAPIADQMRIGQIQATPSSGPRDSSRGATNWAAKSPAATTYHHQRSPFTAGLLAAQFVAPLE